jgi:biotin synthase
VTDFPQSVPLERPLSRERVREIYEMPLPDLMFRAMCVHREHHNPRQIQHCTLSNIKAGGCPEDCAYCPQSAFYETGVRNEPLADVESVVAQARAARAAGSTRFCMGAAWRSPRDEAQFERVLEMIRAVRALGMEACVTLGMLTAAQARRLKEAGLTAYNHNLDTSPEFYPEIISTHTYEDRLATLRHVRAAGIEICSGGIIGMGESRADRIGLLCELANLDPCPESVPINALMPVEGTPLAGSAPLDAIEIVRTIATARILMPRSRVRLSAGRTRMTTEAQAMCFLAGANSIFTGEKLLTTPNPGQSSDEQLLATLGMEKEPLPAEAPSPFVPLVELDHGHEAGDGSNAAAPA